VLRDAALDQAEHERGQWLTASPGDATRHASALRRLLARAARRDAAISSPARSGGR
jgi:hypothetical protein